MNSRDITTPEQLEKAIKALRKVELPFVITVGAQKVRSNAANASYWADLQFHLDEVSSALELASEATGHTVLELRQMIAKATTPEYSLLIFSIKKESLHEHLKIICDIPTSTRLSKKFFAKFYTIMQAHMTSLLAEVYALTGEAQK